MNFLLKRNVKNAWILFVFFLLISNVIVSCADSVIDDADAGVGEQPEIALYATPGLSKSNEPSYDDKNNPGRISDEIAPKHVTLLFDRTGSVIGDKDAAANARCKEEKDNTLFADRIFQFIFHIFAEMSKGEDANLGDLSFSVYTFINNLKFDIPLVSAVELNEKDIKREWNNFFDNPEFGSTGKKGTLLFSVLENLPEKSADKHNVLYVFTDGFLNDLDVLSSGKILNTKAKNSVLTLEELMVSKNYDEINFVLLCPKTLNEEKPNYVKQWKTIDGMDSVGNAGEHIAVRVFPYLNHEPIVSEKPSVMLGKILEEQFAEYLPENSGLIYSDTVMLDIPFAHIVSLNIVGDRENDKLMGNLLMGLRETIDIPNNIYIKTLGDNGSSDACNSSRYEFSIDTYENSDELFLFYWVHDFPNSSYQDILTMAKHDVHWSIFQNGDKLESFGFHNGKDPVRIRVDIIFNDIDDEVLDDLLNCWEAKLIVGANGIDPGDITRDSCEDTDGNYFCKIRGKNGEKTIRAEWIWTPPLYGNANEKIHFGFQVVEATNLTVARVESRRVLHPVFPPYFDPKESPYYSDKDFPYSEELTPERIFMPLELSDGEILSFMIIIHNDVVRPEIIVPKLTLDEEKTQSANMTRAENPKSDADQEFKFVLAVNTCPAPFPPDSYPVKYETLDRITSEQYFSVKIDNSRIEEGVHSYTISSFKHYFLSENCVFGTIQFAWKHGGKIECTILNEETVKCELQH